MREQRVRLEDLSTRTLDHTLDVGGPLTQVLATSDGRDAATYLYGLSRLAAFGTKETRFFAPDVRGSPRLLTDERGAVAGVRGFDAWGVPNPDRSVANEQGPAALSELFGLRHDRDRAGGTATTQTFDAHSCCNPMDGSSGTRRRATVSRLRAASACVMIAVLLGACTSSDPDLAGLQREPAAGLRMAETTELGHFAGDKALTLDGPLRAHDDRIFGTQASDEAVRAFYDQELRRLGWQADRLATAIASTELAAWGWCKGAMVFSIGIQDQPRAFRPEFYKGQTFRTVFDAGLTGRDPSLSCPTRIPR